MIGSAASAYTGPKLLRRFLLALLRSIRHGQPDLITVGGGADGHESQRRTLRGLLGSEVFELNKQGYCRARADDDVMLVTHSILQNPPYRAAHVLKAPAGALQAFYRRAVQVRDAEVEHSGAHAGKHSALSVPLRYPAPLPSPIVGWKSPRRPPR